MEVKIIFLWLLMYSALCISINRKDVSYSSAKSFLSSFVWTPQLYFAAVVVIHEEAFKA